MKRTFYLSTLILISGLFLLSFVSQNKKVNLASDDLELGFPEEVQTVLSTSCFDCHTDGSKSDDALKDLNFSNWADFDDAKKIGEFEGIVEVLEKGEMPKKKYLEYYPEKALSDEQSQLLITWAKEEADKLMGE